jgi:hypothetical protein
MRTETEYRKLAGDCVHLAQTASTPQQRSTLLHIAHVWLKLGDQAGEQAVGPKIRRNGAYLAEAAAAS